MMQRFKELFGRQRARYEPVADTEMVTAPVSSSVHSIPSSALVRGTMGPGYSRLQTVLSMRPCAMCLKLTVQ